METEVLRIQLYEPYRTEGTDCQSEHKPDERQNSRYYLAKETVFDGSSNQEAEPIFDGMVRLFCVGGYAQHIQEPRIVDSKKAPHVHVEELEEAKYKSEETHRIGYPEREGIRMGQLAQKLLAYFKKSNIA